jgi:Glyoxalase-like domain
MPDSHEFPKIRGVALDCPDPRSLAEFYRALLGLEYRPGDEPPPPGDADLKGDDWLVLKDEGVNLAFQKVTDLIRSTWPDGAVPQQLHLDTSVPTKERLEFQKKRAVDLGARVLFDRSDDSEEPLYVFADPVGHPFCIFVVPTGD